MLAIVFSGAAGIGLLLAIMQFMIWLRYRDRRAFLFAAAMSGAAGVMALTEAGFLGEVSADRFQFLFKINNIAIAVTLVAMTWFVRARLNTGRLWLAWFITVSWASMALLDLFASGSGIPFFTLESIEQLQTTWGETYSVPVGTIHPLKYVSDITSLVILLFVIDASLTAYRHGDTRSALRVGLPIVFFILVAGIHTPLVDAGLIKTPYIISLVFVAISISLALELVDGVVRSATLSRKLDVERQRWNALLADVELAVVRVTPEDTIGFVNPHMEKLTGKSRADLLGQDVASLLPQNEAEEVRRVLRRADSWASRSRDRRKLISATGDVRDIDWFSVALRNDAGEPDGVISFGQDVTDQMIAEKGREENEREIEKLSRALTMGELASTFAHELSQPIAAVLSNAQTLKILQGQDAEASGEAAEILNDILRDTRRARDLMARIREFVFNEAPKESTFEFGKMVDEAVGMVTAEATRSGVVVSKDGPGDEIWVVAARLELLQVVLNLVLNAIQAVSSKGSGAVVVGWSQSDEGILTLSVADDGPGLAEDKHASVFAPFNSSKSKGTGIGLAVVRRVAERHEGDVSVAQSRLGGAKFVLTLPIVRREKERAVG